MTRWHELLRFLRIENEHGTIKLTTIMLAFGAYLGRGWFAMALAAWALEMILQHWLNVAGMRGAHSIALAKKQADAEAQAKRMEEIEKQLREALTPERMQLARDMLKRGVAGMLRNA